LGLQRSGTNYLSKLVEINSNTETQPLGPREICWKHAMPWELQSNGFSAIDSISRFTCNLGVIIISKHPFQWLDSLVSREPQDFFKSKKGAMVSGEISLRTCASIYNAYYASWLSFLGSGVDIHVRYIDTLMDVSAVMGTIFETFNLSLKEPISVPTRVPYTKKFSELDKLRYINGKCVLNDSMLDEFRSYLDVDIVRRLGYSLEER